MVREQRRMKRKQAVAIFETVVAVLFLHRGALAVRCHRRRILSDIVNVYFALATGHVTLCRDNKELPLHPSCVPKQTSHSISALPVPFSHVAHPFHHWHLCHHLLPSHKHLLLSSNWWRVIPHSVELQVPALHSQLAVDHLAHRPETSTIQYHCATAINYLWSKLWLLPWVILVVLVPMRANHRVVISYVAMNFQVSPVLAGSPQNDPSSPRHRQGVSLFVRRQYDETDKKKAMRPI